MTTHRRLAFAALLFSAACGESATAPPAHDGGSDGGSAAADLALQAGDLAGLDLAPPAGDAAVAPLPDLAVVPDLAEPPYLFPAVWIIIMENHNRAELLTPSANDPTLKMLASTYATADMFSSPLHPSLPNYIEMTCGCNAAHSAVTSPDTSASGVLAGAGLFGDTSLGGQLEAAGVPWRAYAQDSATGSKLTPCRMSNTGRYASRHVPFLYFTDVFGTGMTASATCTNRVRVFGSHTAKTGDFFDDLAAGTYVYQWITPDLVYDMHDGTIADGDGFIAAVVPEIQNSPLYQAGGVIFITWDEGANGSNQMLFIAVSTRAKMGFKSPTAFNHDNFLATIQDIYKLPRTGASVGKTNMMELFQ